MMVRIATDHDTPLAIDRYLIGFRTPMLHAPTGLCYLAYCEEATRASVLDLIARSASTAERRLTGSENLEFTLDQIRRQGFCHIRFAEYREGGLAAPLFADGKVIGGIVMRYIKSTIKAPQLEDQYVPIVQKLASDISEAYGRRLAQKGLEANDDLPNTEVVTTDLEAARMAFGVVSAQAAAADGLRRAFR
jgi:IclR family mhp operon transcriptional activator